MIFLENNIPFPLAFFYIFLHNSSPRLCLWLSQQLWILIWQHLLAMWQCILVSRWQAGVFHVFLDRQEYFWLYWYLQVICTPACCSNCTWTSTVQNELVAKTYLFMCSVAFVATQNILLKASNLFWYLLKDEGFASKQKLMVCNVFWWTFLWSLPLKRFKISFSWRTSWHLYLLQFVFY